MDPAFSKICSRCGAVLPMSEFAPGRIAYPSYCRSCRQRKYLIYLGSSAFVWCAVALLAFLGLLKGVVVGIVLVPLLVIAFVGRRYVGGDYVEPSPVANMTRAELEARNQVLLQELTTTVRSHAARQASEEETRRAMEPIVDQRIAIDNEISARDRRWRPTFRDVVLRLLVVAMLAVICFMLFLHWQTP